MYPAELVAPMKTDLTEVGFKELTTPAEVDAVLKEQNGTTFLVINSVCGCAAGSARPGIREAVTTGGKLPSNLVTAFAGVDSEAVARAREYTTPYPASSPSMALFKDGKLVHFIERHQIEGNNASAIATHLKKVFEHFC
ncbi:MAG: BrxA/BrxB family bacilliredoxin [Chitinophagales bacterium]|nr:BrxA/BrxB family bacilliredoxin [Chitinophagales bacterium]MCO5281173.1 BrxA/BrxB family bacilliredoxin [Chitinophagales bacterium]